MEFDISVLIPMAPIGNGIVNVYAHFGRLLMLFLVICIYTVCQFMFLLFLALKHFEPDLAQNLMLGAYTPSGC